MVSSDERRENGKERKESREIIDPSLTQGWSAHVKDPDGIWIELFQLTEPS